jgi:Phosphoadenosine phosphosulfate reductase family
MSNEKEKGFVIAWWSGGITSAVACRLALNKYENVRLVYIETGSHHEDTIRFKSDCEAWYGQQIETIQNEKYDDHFDVVTSTGYVNGSSGARCTIELKKNVRFRFEKQNTVLHQVWGYEFDVLQINRAIRTQEQYAYTNPLFPLIEDRLNKIECAGIIQAAGIELPVMYKLGYNNNNCVGCVKGGAGYWNKIRVDFPAIFEKMVLAEREVGYSCIKDKNGPVFLDTLDPSAGRATDMIVGDCGIFCAVSFADIITPRAIEIFENKSSIYNTPTL